MRMVDKNKENMEKEDLEEGEDQEQQEEESLSQEDNKDEDQEEEAKGGQDSDELQQYKDRIMRLQADFDNFKKRTQKEKDGIHKYALEDFFIKMLPVIDNMERAVQVLDDSEIEDEYASGVKMVLTQLKDLLEKEGLEEIGKEGDKFDPNCHHGVSVEQSIDHEEDQIIEVF
ncbi:MAG TPA: nucleotide exchange factor GrpE, partial [Eubacteriaceae bacterium]|nr:nucleotide exchange factor GrpE [Eubacteriaceae bacterium]